MRSQRLTKPAGMTLKLVAYQGIPMFLATARPKPLWRQSNVPMTTDGFASLYIWNKRRAMKVAKRAAS